MTAKIFTTNEYGEFTEKKLFHGNYLYGVETVTKETEYNSNFLGLGVAITGSSCYNLSLMLADERHKLLTDLYSKNGLNLNIGRLSIGSSDYSTAVYSYDDVENDTALRAFSIERDTEYIIPIIKEILQINPDIKLFASPWSPPFWMKAGGGYMREKYLECYADYFVKYIKAYSEYGIPIYAVTPQNECETPQNGRMSACVWHPETEAKFIAILRKKFDINNINTKIWAYDHSFNGIDRVTWCLNAYPEMRSSCDSIAFHYYSGCIEDTKIIKDLYPELSLQFTEGGPRLYDNYDTDWCKWTLMMIKALNSKYSSFTGWNLMLDETGGPNVGPFFCGGLITRNYKSGELSYSGQYKALRHIAPYINTDSKIYPLSITNKSGGMSGYNGKKSYDAEGSIIENPDGSQALVIVNPADRKKQLQYFLDGKWWYIELLPNTSATILFEA